MNGHDLMSDKDGTQACETEDDIIPLTEKEEGQDALFPEMGVASAIMDNLQTTDVVAGLNRGMGADDSKGELLLRHRLAHIIGIAFDTRHGLRQESAVDIYSHD